MAEFQRYKRIIASSSPKVRKALYKHREAKFAKSAIERYERPEKIRKSIERRIEKTLNRRVQARAILRKQPRATYTIRV